MLSTDEYAGRVSELIGLYEYFQLIDIELSAGDDIVRELTEAARNKGLAVVISQHSFTDTPPKQEMIDTLTHMHELGADLPKLAVSPGSPADLFDLMSASLLKYRPGDNHEHGRYRPSQPNRGEPHRLLHNLRRGDRALGPGTAGCC